MSVGVISGVVVGSIVGLKVVERLLEALEVTSIDDSTIKVELAISLEGDDASVVISTIKVEVSDSAVEDASKFVVVVEGTSAVSDVSSTVLISRVEPGVIESMLEDVDDASGATSVLVSLNSDMEVVVVEASVVAGVGVGTAAG